MRFRLEICVLLVILLISAHLVPIFAVDLGAVITDVSVIGNKDRLLVSGRISSGEDMWVSIKIKEPDGSITYLNSRKSSINGEFEFGYLFEIALKGLYHIELKGSGENDILYQTSYDYNPSMDNSLYSFIIEEKRATISDSSISLTLPAGTDRNGLIAYFSANDKAVVKIGDVEQISGITRNNYTNPIVYSVYAEDGSVKDYTVRISVESKSSGGGGGTSYTAEPVISSPKETLAPLPTPDPAIPPEATGEYFVDVPSDYWAAGYIEILYDNGILNGVSETNFAPDEPVMREEFVKMICEALMLDIPKVNSTDYTDVDINSWYAPYINSASSHKLITGINETQFGVGMPIIRQDMAVLINRSAKLLNMDFIVSNQQFGDSNLISDYALDGVYSIRSMGIINGVGGNYFNPLGIATRAQAAKMIYVLLYIAGDI